MKWLRRFLLLQFHTIQKYYRKTILSILGQSYRPLEYVFVDGGSKDGTINLIKSIFQN